MKLYPILDKPVSFIFLIHTIHFVRLPTITIFF